MLVKNIKLIFICLSILVLFCLFLLTYNVEYSIHGQNVTISAPSLRDSNHKVELVVRNLDFPTGIDFLGKDDFLISEKDTGNVKRILNGNVTGPLVHIDVGSKDERGLLGIAISKYENNSSLDNSFVYLYYTQCLE